MRLPSVSNHIPRLNDTCIRAETCGKGFSSIHKNSVITRYILESQAVAITVVNHETHVMVPFFGCFDKECKLLLGISDVVMNKIRFIRTRKDDQ